MKTAAPMSLLAFAVALFTGCEPLPEHLRQCPALARTYFAMPMTERVSEFASQSLDAQYEIYLCGMQYMHPPTDLATPFASQGQVVAQYLLHKVQGGVDDTTFMNIVFVYRIMTIEDAYDVRGDAALMRALESRSRQMTDRALEQEVSMLIEEMDR